MNNELKKDWEAPEWVVKMATDLETPKRPVEMTINDVRGALNSDGWCDPETFGKHISEDELLPTPELCLQDYPNLPKVLPARVVKLLEKYNGRNLNWWVNNFSKNMTCRMKWISPDLTIPDYDQPLEPRQIILNYPSITAGTRGEMYDDFEETIKRLGIREAFVATTRQQFTDQNPEARDLLLEKYGWCGSHDPDTSNKVAFPAFVDMASRGWSIHFLAQ